MKMEIFDKKYIFVTFLTIFAVILANGASLTADSVNIVPGVEVEVQAKGGVSSRQFNPYLLSWGNNGVGVTGGTALVGGSARIDFDYARRFSYAAGAEVYAGYGQAPSYEYFSSNADDSKGVVMQYRDNGPSAAWVQQLYAAIKWRGVYLFAGMKNAESPLVDDELSSGDLVHSNNARPIPQVCAGFVNWQDVPFTGGWLQIEGCVAYGKMTDSRWIRHQFNYYNGHIATGTLYAYKRAYFRIAPQKPLTLVIGAQNAGQFGGKTQFWRDGDMVGERKNPQNLRAFWDMFLQHRGNGDGFYEGSQLGSWDLRAEYRFGKKYSIAGYFQWLWEDGSSMARRNKWDGLWGVQYTRTDAEKTFPVLASAVLEYIDFRDQSGPMHWAPGDRPGTTIVTEATGADDYYNNSSFNAYANYGMSLGSPFVVSPLYNTDGYPQFAHTVSRGFHAAARGYVGRGVQWRLAVSSAVARGTSRMHLNRKLHNTSAMAEATVRADAILAGLNAAMSVGFDAGSLRGNNFGAMLTLKYSCNINI